MKRIIVYGTLKRGFVNYNALLKNANFKGSTKIEGYQMYSFIYFPVIIHTNNPEDKVFVECYEVTDEVFKKIDTMERGAGYITINETVIVGDNKFNGTVWIYEKQPNDNLIINGNWCKKDVTLLRKL